MKAGNLGLPNEAYGDAFRVTFAKKPKLIPKNLEIPEAGAGAVSVLECRKEIAELVLIFYINNL
jgi:hypothetical protein